jgi:MFS family permease
VGINVSRAIGPALGGAVILGLGVAWPFLINALSYLIVIAALVWWRPPPVVAKVLPSEQFFAAIRSGLRYSRASDPLKRTLYRTVLFVVFASANFALLPLIARVRLNGGAELYGLLVGCIGAGAVTAAILLPRIRERLGPSRLVALSTVMTAAVLTAIALSRETAIALAASLIAGASWIAALSSFHVSTQMSLPEWVRARGLSIYTAVFFGSLAGGSLLWGQLAAHVGLPAALLVAAVGAMLGLWPASRFALQSGDSLDLGPSSHWPQPIVSGDAALDRGPVIVTVEYLVQPEQAARFLEVMKELGKARRRGGAFGWGIYRDAAEAERYLEYFVEESWLGHLRHHERVTEDDRDLQERVASFHSGPAAPQVRHYLAAGAPRPGKFPQPAGDRR